MNKLIDLNVNILCTMVPRKGFKNMEVLCTTCILIDRIDQDVIEDLSICLENNRNIISYIQYAGKPIIVHIFSDLERKVEKKEIKCGYITYIQIGILDLLFGVYSKISLIWRMLYNKLDKDKYNVLFVFSGMLWSNVVLLFKLNQVTLHGGRSTSRHKISLKHYKLLEYLNLFARYDYSVLEYILIQNMKEIKKTDPYISKEIYKYISVTTPREINENLVAEKKKELFKEHEQVLINFKYFNENLLKKITLVEHYLKLKSEIGKLERAIAESNYLDNKEGESNVVGLTKYQKRLVKKEIKGCEERKLNKLELIRLKEELNKLESSNIFNQMSGEIISNIGNDLQRLNNQDKFELLKYRSFPADNLKGGVQNPIFLSKRKYHSSSIVISGVQSKSENKIISFIEEQGLSFKNYNVENSEKLQFKLENLWLLTYTNKLKDDKYLESKNTILTVKTIKEGYKTLNLYYTNKQIDKNFYKIEEDLNDEELIFLTYSLLLSYYNRLALTALSMSIGNYILLHIFYKRKYIEELNKWKKIKRDKVEDEILNIDHLSDRNVESTYLNFNDFKESNDFCDKNTVKLGDFFISIFCQFPSNVFEREHSIDSYYSKNGIKLKINPLFLNDIKENLIISPTVLPMLCEPNLWSENSYGGLLKNKTEKTSLITGSKHHKHKIENKGVLYSAINYLNSTKFRINKLFLNYIMNEGNYLLEKDKSDPLQRKITLSIAELLDQNDHLPFYLTTNADWRSRIYTQSFYITYQGGDLTTALLNFWEGEPLTESGLFYLKIYGANNHNQSNISKSSFLDRIKWVDDNYDKIINLDPELISSAENIFIFTAFCLNMKLYNSDPQAKIFTPVFLDATCSGIQHLAGLLLDVELAKQSNLTPNSQQDIPADFYTSLIEPINFAINKLGENDLKHSQLKEVKLNRKILKQSIMTKVYNVTRFGIADQIKNKLKKVEIKKEESKGQLKSVLVELLSSNLKIKQKYNKITMYEAPTKDGKKILISNQDIFKIAEIIDREIFILYPSLYYIYNYFMDIASLMLKLNIPLSWITPAGLKITQHYLKTKQINLAIRFAGKNRKMVLRESTKELDTIKQTQAIIPNIIHSLDANHIISLINNCKKEEFYPIITIHDCFGTLPNKMEQLESRIKNEFILLYTNDHFLKKFHDKTLESIKDNQFEIIEIKNSETGSIENYVEIMGQYLRIPDKPKMGELDLQNLRSSNYMVS